MKRFILGMLVGFFVVSALYARSRAVPPPVFFAPAEPVPPRVVLVQHDPNEGFPPVRDGRESVSDIPVPIVPNTRVTEARIQPPNPRAPAPPIRRMRHVAVTPRSDQRVITGRLQSTEEKARDDVRKQVDAAVAEWLEPEVESSWNVPVELRIALVQKTEVRAVQKELDGERATLYEASQTVDFSHERRAKLVDAYNHELVERRLAILAGVIGFILTCLAALAGYIRADEATKGYYTNRLRLVSAAGVGASGVLIYQLLV